MPAARRILNLEQFDQGAEVFAFETGPLHGPVASQGASIAGFGSFEALEQLSTFASRAHALICCPCGEDHSGELLAFKMSLTSVVGDPGVRLVSESVQYAPGGSPQSATVVIAGDVAGNTGSTTVLNIGDSVVSQIESSGDQDWYRVTLVAGVTYQFDLMGTGGDALADPYLELMNASGDQLKFDDDGGTELNSLLRFTPTTSGTYFVNAHGWIDAGGATSTGSYTLTATQAPALPTYTVAQIADYLVYEGSSSGRAWTQTNITYNIEALTLEQQALAQRAFSVWAAVTPLTFTRTTGTGNITLTNVDPNPEPDPANPGEFLPSAFAQNTFSGPNVITASTVVITSNWFGGDVTFDSYTQQTYIHEIGHALGLGHAGPYNGAADFGTDNIYSNDNWSTTVMSYFDQDESGFGSYRFVLGLQQADIAAIQLLYGSNPAGTHAGNTTFGFNSTAPGTNIDWSQFVVVNSVGTYRRPPSMTLYDTGGVDTINLSGFAQPQIVNLNPGTSSSLGDRTPTLDAPSVHYVNVISIAAGTIIENVIGGSGSDTITGNSENNAITLGGGADIFVYAPNGGADTIRDFATTVDRIDLTAFSSSAALSAFNGRTASGGGTLLTFGAGQTILLQGVSTSQLTQSNLIMAGGPPPPPPPPAPTGGDDVLYGTAGNDLINALAGNDTVFGLGGADRLEGGDGNDILVGEAGFDTLIGDAGNDALYGGADDDNLYGMLGNDFLYGEAGNDQLVGNEGDDRLEGGDGADALIGGAGFDTLIGDAGNDALYGGADGDNLYGMLGNDFLYGEAGNDQLVGNEGDDRLEGGDGADTFIFSAGNDVVVDFGIASGDRVNVSTIAGMTSLAALQAIHTQVGANSVFTFSAGNSITLNNVTLAQLNAAHFVFASSAEPQDETGKAEISASSLVGDDPDSLFDFSGIEAAVAGDEWGHGPMYLGDEWTSIVSAEDNTNDLSEFKVPELVTFEFVHSLDMDGWQL
ncbi:MAG: M10 family metallopeptidase [Pannonibacter sp.]